MTNQSIQTPETRPQRERAGGFTETRSQVEDELSRLFTATHCHGFFFCLIWADRYDGTMLLRSLFCLGFFVTFACTASAQDKPRTLPPEVMQKMQEAQELQQRQRFVDAIAKLDELEALAPDLPDLHNMRGSIYLSPALRDFDKAKELFEKADKLSPGSLAPRFNLAELSFVKHDWAAAEAAFQQLLKDFPKLPMSVRHLVIYKSLICSLKQDQVPAAEKTLKDSFTFMDDTPAYYFSQAALAFQKKDETTAKDWMARASGIFKNDENSAYMDSLMEARWVPNIGLPSAQP